jgi:hypothetical protein
MGCCLFAAIVIGHWLTLWDRCRHALRCLQAWVLRRPPPAKPATLPSAAGVRPRARLSPAVRSFIAMEAVALAVFAWHEAEGGHPHHAQAAADGTPLCTQPPAISRTPP